MSKAGDMKRRILDRIAQDGLSQKAIAAELGISASHLSQVLSGKREGSYELIMQIAEAVGIDTTVRHGIEPTGTTITMSHDQLIRLFKHKERAVVLNYLLLQVEALDPPALQEVEVFLNGLIQRLEREKLGGERLEAEQTL